MSKVKMTMKAKRKKEDRKKETLSTPKARGDEWEQNKQQVVGLVGCVRVFI